MVKEPVKNILLVDDEREYVETLSERLFTRGIHAEVAFSGEEALSSIEIDRPDVVVLDLKMPGMDGLDVLQRIRKDYPKTEVIMLTGTDPTRKRPWPGIWVFSSIFRNRRR